MLAKAALFVAVVPAWFGMLWTVLRVLWPDWQRQNSDTELDTATYVPYTGPIS